MRERKEKVFMWCHEKWSYNVGDSQAQAVNNKLIRDRKKENISIYMKRINTL